MQKIRSLPARRWDSSSKRIIGRLIPKPRHWFWVVVVPELPSSNSCFPGRMGKLLKNHRIGTQRRKTGKARNDFSHAENLILEASDSSGRTAEAIMAKLPSQSLIVNATGMGKDLPGSPIPDSSNFPDHAIVWELNYRGSLEFYRHAQDQQKRRKNEGP